MFPEIFDKIIFAMNEKEHLQNLLSDNSDIRQTATRALWDLWLCQAGGEAESRIRRGTQEMDKAHYEIAQEVFEGLVLDFPDFAEAHNKLATVLYMQRIYSQSINECEVTLKLNPNHFGAWNGLGLCHYRLAHYQKAIDCFKMALSIQPFAEFN